MKEFLSEKKVVFAYVDITGGMGPLKQFLKLRDCSEVFTDVRENHFVGIPTLFVDDKPYIIEDVEHAEKLILQLKLSNDVDS